MNPFIIMRMLLRKELDPNMKKEWWVELVLILGMDVDFSCNYVG